MSPARAQARFRTDTVHVAGMAILIAAIVAAIAATTGGTLLHALGAAAYIAITVGALFAPALIMAQVVAGQVIVAGLLLRTYAAGGSGPQDASVTLLLVALLVGVVATAELLAVVDRIATSVDHDPRDALRRVALASSVAGGVAGIVLLLGSMPGPTGLVALALACGACITVALVLAGQRGRP